MTLVPTFLLIFLSGILGTSITQEEVQGAYSLSPTTSEAAMFRAMQLKSNKQEK